MNCDDVFDVLTRGPFPTGAASDADVELHLEECSGCRQLAEALRPAIALFEEAMGAEEARVLPGYWGSRSPERREQAVAVAAPSARAPGATTRYGRFAPRAIGTSRFAAALMVGLAAAGAGIGLGWPENVTNEYVVAAACIAPLGQDVHESSTDSRSHVLTLTETDVTRLQCCTDCHTAERRQSLTAPAVAQILLTCNLCHAE
jgi:hypothetical protein